MSISPDGTQIRRLLDVGRALVAEHDTVYRVVQEALTNVVKHARASTVRVSVAATSDEVTIEVQDDGVGFDPEVRTAGFGLAGMRERVYLAGGTLALESTNPGTRVRACLPRAGAGETR